MSKNNGEKKNKSVRRIASNIVLVCLLGIAAVSGYKVYDILKNYHKDQGAYEKVSEAADANEFTGDIDFDALAEINSDVIAWIYCEDTKINYPVVKAPDNSKYLTTLFDGSAGGAGAIFADCLTEDPFHQFNTIVYGHHMKDGSMFNNLKLFKDASFAEEHPQMEIILPDGKYHLQIYAFLNQSADSYIYTPNVSTTETQKYIDWITAKASYTTAGVTLATSDRIVALSTCAYEYDGARYIVVGKLVPWE